MSGGISLERYAPSAATSWDDLVRGARARHFMFERRYMDYHSDRFADASWIVLRGGRPVAAFPASSHGDEIVSHGGLTFGGLLSGPELTMIRTVEALRVLGDALRADGARRLVYKPMPHIYHLEAAEEDLVALVSHGARLCRRDVSAAIAPGTAVVQSAERRRAISRATDAGVRVVEDERVEAFMELVADVLAERHEATPVHTPAEMRMLAERCRDAIRLFTACLGDEPIAGVLVYETPAVAHAQYIAATDRGRELGGSDAVFSHLISERYRDRWVDFGISNERDGTLNGGLMRNKEGFGARAVAYDRYVLDLR